MNNKNDQFQRVVSNDQTFHVAGRVRACCGPHGAKIHTRFGDVTVPVLLLTSF